MLVEIATSGPRSLREDARIGASENSEADLGGIREAFAQRRYEEAYKSGLEMLNANPQGTIRLKLLEVLGNSSYRLSLIPGSEQGQQEDRAIKHLERALGSLEAESLRNLASAYYNRAMRRYRRRVRESGTRSSEQVRSSPCRWTPITATGMPCERGCCN